MKAKRILMILAGLAILLLPLWAGAEIVASGTCGENAAWELDDAGALTVSGTGSMATYISWDKEKVKSAVVEEGITDVYFYGCENMTSVSLPDSLTCLGYNAFAWCWRLENVTIPDQVTTLGGRAFFYCTSLKGLTLPEGVTAIGTAAFYECTSLSEMTIPEGVDTIPTSAFAGCSDLKEISLPKSVRTIGKDAFSECTALKEVKYAGSDAEWAAVAIESGNAALKKAAGAEILEEGQCGDDIGWTLTAAGMLKLTGSGAIPDYTRDTVPWAGVRGMISGIELGSDITAIGDYAFYGLKLKKEMTVPATVARVGEEAFGDFAGILHFAGHAPAIAENAFTNGRVIVWYPKDDGTWKNAAGQMLGGRMVIWKEDKEAEPDGERDETEKKESEKTDNENGHDYNVWSHSTDSYLTEADDGTMYRVEYTGEKIVVEQYNEQKDVIWKKTLQPELPYWGGFYSGTDYNFIAVGDSNNEESDEKEILRVIRFSKNWNRIDHASVYGGNTVYPFDAGSLRMAQNGDYLFIHTCHEMYTTSDGLNHQANMNYQLYIPAMQFINSYYQIGNSGGDYVSHSFDQYVLIDGENVVKVDLGDAYPRSVTLLVKKGSANALEDTSYRRVSLLEIGGETGNNYTGVTLGGAEVSSGGYLVVGRSIDQGRFGDADRDNIFAAYVPRDSVNADSVRFRWITQYPDEDTRTLATPQFVKISGSRFLLLWTETASGTYSADRTLRYVFLDSKGEKASEIYAVSGLLSDCSPIVRKNQITWYVTSSSDTIFYTIDLNNPSEVSIETKSNWLYENGNRVYYGADGKKATGFRTIDTANSRYNWDTGEYETYLTSETYYFDGDGHMVTGLQRIGGKTYFFRDNGIMVTGFNTVEDATYYFTADGALTGLQKIEEKYYYFDADGKRQTGWQTVEGKKYYIRNNGVMAAGFFEVDDETYYGTENGVLTGLQKMELDEPIYNRETQQLEYRKVKKTYYFDADGKRQNGWQTAGGEKYYLTDDGAVTGLKYIEGKRYYFGDEGEMLTGFRTVDGTTCYFTEDGVLTGLQVIEGKRYYFSENGSMITGLREVGDATYYFTENGALTGLQKVEVEERVYNPNTQRFEDQTIQRTYYFDADGKEQTGLQTVNGKKYYFGEKGLETGFRDIGDETYYFTENGALTGEQTIEGTDYLFDENGVLQDRRLPGDVNGDREVDGRDVIRLMKWLSDEMDEETGEPVEIVEENADLNGDGKVDERDLLKLVRYFGGEIGSLD